MRIIKIISRRHTGSDIEYQATVDLETDVTKYGNEKLEDRIKTDFYPLEILEKSVNYSLFIKDLIAIDQKLWKENLSKNISIFFGENNLTKKISKILTT